MLSSSSVQGDHSAPVSSYGLSNSGAGNRRWSVDFRSGADRRNSGMLSNMMQGRRASSASASQARPVPRRQSSHSWKGANSHDLAHDNQDGRSDGRLSVSGIPSRHLGRNDSFRTGLGSISGMDALRIQHELMLVSNANHMNATEEDDVSPTKSMSSVSDLSDPHNSRAPLVYRLPQLFLNLYGIIPFEDGCFSSCFVNLVFVLLCGLFMHSLVLAYLDPIALYLHLTTAFYGFGGVCGVLSLRMKEIETVLGPANRPLDSYARNYGFIGEWRVVSMWRFFASGGLFAVMVLCRLAAYAGGGCPEALGGSRVIDGELDLYNLQALVAFILISGLMTAITYCQLHVCCWMELSVDKFCFRFFSDKDITNGINEWNILQAILRRAADKLDSCFLAIGTSVLLQVLLTGMELMLGAQSEVDATDLQGHCQILWCGWMMPPVLMLLMIFFRAAAVTEKCSRVPALVNSWTFEDEPGSQIDHGRQYAVQYIMHSGAGFYVKGVRLSAFMAIKLSYLIGVVTFTLVTQSVLRTSN